MQVRVAQMRLLLDSCADPSDIWAAAWCHGLQLGEGVKGYATLGRQRAQRDISALSMQHPQAPSAHFGCPAAGAGPRPVADAAERAESALAAAAASCCACAGVARGRHSGAAARAAGAVAVAAPAATAGAAPGAGHQPLCSGAAAHAGACRSSRQHPHARAAILVSFAYTRFTLL
jgi:hypothetical protein